MLRVTVIVAFCMLLGAIGAIATVEATNSDVPVSDRLQPSNLGWALALSAAVLVVGVTATVVSSRQSARRRQLRVEALTAAHPHAVVFDLRMLPGGARRDRLQGEGLRLRDIPNETTVVAEGSRLAFWSGVDAPLRVLPWRAISRIVAHSDPEYPSDLSELQIRLVGGGRYQGFVAQGRSEMLAPRDVSELAARLTELRMRAM